MKKALGETQTLHAGRSNTEPKIFAPPQTPFPGAQDRQNLISWRRSLPAPTDPVWWRSMCGRECPRLPTALVWTRCCVTASDLATAV